MSADALHDMVYARLKFPLKRNLIGHSPIHLICVDLLYGFVKLYTL